jgi:hypothetical protein
MPLPKKHAIVIACLIAFLMSLPAAGAFAGGLGFSEVWAYLMDGEERFFDPALPVTDIAYFGAGISSYGKLTGVPRRENLRAYRGRVHLVVAEIGNYALTHFCLDPGLPLRDALVADIVEAAKPYQGVQIDFEAVGSKDYDNFNAFLVLLKKKLGSKTLSVALPACTAEKYDRFGYQRMGKVADRVIVMAYDEHWSSSEPGPVASLAWCRSVAAYALSRIDPGRLVMGAPFYGRAWADKSLSRAYKFSSLAGILSEKGIVEVQRKEDVPYVEYTESVNVKVYFEDVASMFSRLGMYRDASVRNVAFWRLGQEDPLVWTSLATGRLPLKAQGGPNDGTAAALPAALPAGDAPLPLQGPEVISAQ